MTKEEEWLIWMTEAKHRIDYDWDTIKKTSWWQAFSRGWDAALKNQRQTHTPEDVKKIEREWVELTPEEGAEIWGDAHDIDWKRLVPPKEIVKRISDKLKEKNGG